MIEGTFISILNPGLSAILTSLFIYFPCTITCSSKNCAIRWMASSGDKSNSKEMAITISRLDVKRLKSSRIYISSSFISWKFSTRLYLKTIPFLILVSSISNIGPIQVSNGFNVNSFSSFREHSKFITFISTFFVFDWNV